MYDSILVPTDGSDPANRAVAHAIDLAGKYGADLHAMYVVDTDRYGDPALSSTELVLTDLEEDGAELLDDVTVRADAEGVEVTTFVCHGTPYEEIRDHADEIDADVIVMGYKGKSHPRTDMMGSVTQRLLQSTDRPVLTV